VGATWAPTRFLGQSPSRQTFPGYYTGLYEPWMPTSLLSLYVLLRMRHAYLMWWNKGTIDLTTSLTNTNSIANWNKGRDHWGRSSSSSGEGVNSANPFRQIKHCFSLPSHLVKFQEWPFQCIFTLQYMLREIFAVIFSLTRPKSGGTVPCSPKSGGVRIPPVLPINFAYEILRNGRGHRRSHL